jgi:hypothetical protein
MTPRREGASGRIRSGPVRSVAATLARRRDERAPRVLIKSRGGQTRALDPAEPGAKAALEAAEALISAAQSGSSA